MTRPRLVIVKLGGAAITDKSREETLCSKNLAAAAAAVGAAFRENSSPSPHASTRFIVVHGAGSFGHQAAAREGFSSPISQDTNAGDPRRSAAAAARVRASCGRLHSAVVSSLVAAGVPALSHPPAAAGWCSAAHGAEVVDHSCGLLAGLLDAGACPVLHGDVVLDDDAPGGFAVLSGDTIVAKLAEELGGGLMTSSSSNSSAASAAAAASPCFSSSVAVFITDVDGVFSRAPSSKGELPLPPLLRRLRPRRASDGGGSGDGGGGGSCGIGDLIRCSDSGGEEEEEEDDESRGNAAAAAPPLSAGPSSVAEDVTGGMAAKLRAAAAAARAGTTVLVVRVGSRSAAAALVLGAAAPERFRGWRGTMIAAPQATRRTTG